MMCSTIGGIVLWSVLGILLVLGLTAAVAAGLMLVRGRLARMAEPGTERDEARDVVRRRYAAGEIDEDDYLRRMSGLGGH